MLILASNSPRRSELLSQAGLDFIVEAASICEDREPGEPPAQYVQRLAIQKAKAVWDRHRWELNAGSIVTLGADTIVLAEQEVFGKPSGVDDARRMLERLSGRVHQVMTGVAVVTRDATVSDIEITEVFFDTIGERELNRYLATGEPLDKAGAYGIQGFAARWIPRIEGCYFNVVGLPIARTMALLARAGAG